MSQNRDTVNVPLSHPEQLRHLTPLSLGNPPMSFTIELPGLEMNEEGYYQHFRSPVPG